jgi:hypothetical protein
MHGHLTKVENIKDIKSAMKIQLICTFRSVTTEAGDSGILSSEADEFQINDESRSGGIIDNGACFFE